ncbi:MAG: type II TA system antitoxin MqsA family protein [Bryobacteraceae bacterium]
MTCVNCGRGRLQKRLTDVAGEIKGEKFLVRMDALVCPACGYTTVEGSAIPEYMRLIADAYRAKHDLLTGDAIRERRARLRMTQEQFASYIGVGVASVKRWELGQVQDLAMDRLIRLMSDSHEARENAAKVSAMTAVVEPTILGLPLVSFVVGSSSAEGMEWCPSKQPYVIRVADWEKEIAAA